MNQEKKDGTIWLRWLCSLLVSLGVFVGVAHAQSLAEVAEKEKKRRSQVKGSTKVISERDLQTRRSSPLPATAPAEGAAADDATAGEEEGEGELDETKSRDYWQNRVSATKKKILKK